MALKHAVILAGGKGTRLGQLTQNNPKPLIQIGERPLVEHIMSSIEYIGFKDDPFSIVSKADCVVLPSYREGLSRSLLECMALCKPIITSKVPGCKELVINNSNGFLCEPKSSKDLAEKMVKIINLKQNQIKSMGYKGLEIIKEKYTTEIVLDKFLKLIK